MIICNTIPHYDFYPSREVIKLDTFQYKVQVFGYGNENRPFIALRKEGYFHDLKVVKKPIIDDDENDK